MTIDEIHGKLGFIVQHQEAGFFNPERYDWALDMGSMKKFNRMLPVFGMNEVFSESLTPFKRSLDILNANSLGGLITLPADYEYLTGIRKIGYDNARSINTYSDIEVVNDDEIGDRLRSQIIPVTAVKPIAQRIAAANADGSSSQQIQLYPKVPNSCSINYLKRPNKPKFDYTASDPDGIAITYKADTSIQMDWKDSDIYEIMFIALTFLGINLDDKDIAQYGLTLANNP